MSNNEIQVIKSMTPKPEKEEITQVSGSVQNDEVVSQIKSSDDEKLEGEELDESSTDADDDEDQVGEPINLADEKIYGVFSSQEMRKVGTGVTTRKVISKIYWFVEENKDGTLTVQSINTNYIPTGIKKVIDKDELLDKYFPEPEFYTATVYPKIRELNEKIDDGDIARKRGENFTAELEYSTALAIDVNNVRANFGIGLTYLERGDAEKASNIFDRLIDLEGAYEEEHKHLFNEFGINLRKSKMLDQSVTYYKKALEMNERDENLHLNMARVYLENKDFNLCFQHVKTAYDLDPTNEHTKKFLEWLKSKNLLSSEQLIMLRNSAS